MKMISQTQLCGMCSRCEAGRHRFAFPDPDFFLQTVKSSNHFSYETADFAVEISIKLLSHLQDLDIKKITNVRFTVEG